MSDSSLQSSLRYYFPPVRNHSRALDCDLCIYGANSGGTIAAIAAVRNGLSVVLLEPSRHLGGLTAGGLGLTDIGNKFAIGGLSREFYRRVGVRYGVEEHWRFEPHVAEKVFNDWLQEEGIECIFESFLDKVEVENGRIRRLSTEHGVTVTAKFFIDATYEGDLLAKAGVSFACGREDNTVYGESLNGSQVRNKHQFDLPVDPYRIEGDPASGLLEGVEDTPHLAGKGDHRIQAYNFRLCLTNVQENRIAFTQPPGYCRERYELLTRYFKAGYKKDFNKFDPLVNGKIDLNNHGAVSTDFIGANFAFPTASYEQREEIFQRHVEWIKGLLWYWSSDPAVNADFQQEFAHWGWCRDEFVATGGFSHALYVREARRLVGDVVMTEHHCLGKEVAEDPVALAAYTMDSHNCRRLVIDGRVQNEGDVQVASGPPYPISYRAIIPKRGECGNLFVPFCLSASHIAFGSIRMEPVYMILAESAVHAATIALEMGCTVQDVPYAELESRLRAAGQVLDPVPEFALA